MRRKATRVGAGLASVLCCGAMAVASSSPYAQAPAPAIATPSAPAVPADRPAPRTDQNSMTAHAQLLEKARAGRIDVYFVGDSIPRRWGALADKDGRLFAGMMNERDKLHPTLQGYQVWAYGLKPILTEVQGPPAATDVAPPPTGDPSARPEVACRVVRARRHGDLDCPPEGGRNEAGWALSDTRRSDAGGSARLERRDSAVGKTVP